MIMKADNTLLRGEATEFLKRRFVESKGPVNVYLWHNNEAAVEWLESQMSSSAQSTLTQNLECIKKDRVLRQVQALVSCNPDVGLEAVVQLSQQLSVNQRSQVVKLLTTVDDLNTTCSRIDET